MIDRQSVLSVSGDGPAGFDNQNRWVPRALFRFIVHVLFATIGGLVIGGIVLGSLHPILSHHHRLLFKLLTDLPYSPAFWLSALLVGFVVNTFMRDRSACWVGVVCVSLFAGMIVASIPGYERSAYDRQRTHNSFGEYIYGELFSLDDNECGGDECLGKMLITAPVLSSVAYSFGAWLALHPMRKREAGEN
jgi:hypothetical protein